MIVDLTTRRLGTRTRGHLRIGRCPRCSRKGEVARYDTGEIRVTHQLRERGPFLEVIDYCWIPAGEE